MIQYELNKTERTAEIVKSNSIDGELIIPSSIIYESEVFVITKIKKKAFNLSKSIKSLNFSSD